MEAEISRVRIWFHERGPRKFHVGNFFGAVTIAIQPNDWASAIVNLLFVTMRCILDLAALITFFHRRQHAAEPLDFAELIEDRGFYCTLDRLHPGRPAQHVHGVFENARFLQENRLPVRGKPNPFFTWRSELFDDTTTTTRVPLAHLSA